MVSTSVRSTSWTRPDDRGRAVVQDADAARTPEIGRELRQHGPHLVHHRRRCWRRAAAEHGEHQRAADRRSGSPSAVLSTESITRATSPSRTGLPFGEATTIGGTRRRSTSCEFVSIARFCAVADARARRCDGIRRPRPPSSPRRCRCRVPRASSGSTSARTANFFSPKTCTSPTPVERRERRRDHLLGEIVELRQRHRPALQRQQHDRRIGRVDLAVARRRRSSRPATAAASARSPPARRPPPGRCRGRGRTRCRSWSSPATLFALIVWIEGMVVNCLIERRRDGVGHRLGRCAGQLGG